MKTDGYILTPELLQWRYFHRPVVVQVLIYVLLSATHNEASAATLSSGGELEIGRAHV